MKAGYGALTWLVCATAAASGPDAGYDPRNTQVGSLLQIGLPLAGLGLTWLIGSDRNRQASSHPAAALDGADDSVPGLFDWNRLNGSPRHDFVIAFGRMEAVTYGLKYSVDETRPNGQPHSFPSGHTSASFMGAEFIRKQYGWYAGAPAYLAASYVGWTRQQSRNHYSRDVFAGALIGILSNHDLAEFSSSHSSLRISVSPICSGGLGCTSFTGDIDANASAGVGNPRDRPSFVPGIAVEFHF